VSAAISWLTILDGLRKAYKRDRANRYSLNTPWTLPRLAEEVPDYHGPRVTIEDSVPTIQPYAGSDGCTLSPDRVGRWILVEAALAHDALTEEQDLIAAAWGWEVARVRELADNMFYGLACARAPCWLARIYWRGIRAFGGIAHAVCRVGTVCLIAALLCAGCAGCVGPVNPFAPGQPVTPADYEQIK